MITLSHFILIAFLSVLGWYKYWYFALSVLCILFLIRTVMLNQELEGAKDGVWGKRIGQAVGHSLSLVTDIPMLGTVGKKCGGIFDDKSTLRSSLWKSYYISIAINLVIAGVAFYFSSSFPLI